ncbi:hypothetical protein PGT21_009908 [Puccinia graminis f. sp. tritici]|uniref:Uncharacterized protein n=1 Tax=Puccinia graminis f. sp. tritici TaxID=56615 RepID=A0A5B0M641_PUCGR|nr:hypothetical protein PGT21_009908 [Puccinia graminis f. sp. tritici]
MSRAGSFQMAHLALTLIVLISFHSGLLAVSRQRCETIFAPHSGDEYTCMNAREVRFLCGVNSCSSDGLKWADFIFKNCQEYTSENTLTNNFEDIHVEEFATVVLPNRRFLTAKKLGTNTWFRCTWSKQSPFNAHRPTCDSCRPDP